MCQRPSVTSPFFPPKHIKSLGVLTTGGKIINDSNDDVSLVATHCSEPQRVMRFSKVHVQNDYNPEKT